MAKKKSSSVDPEMLKNLDLLLSMDLLEEEENWEVLDEAGEEGEELFEQMGDTVEEDDET